MMEWYAQFRIWYTCATDRLIWPLCIRLRFPNRSTGEARGDIYRIKKPSWRLLYVPSVWSGLCLWKWNTINRSAASGASLIFDSLDSNFKPGVPNIADDRMWSLENFSQLTLHSFINYFPYKQPRIEEDTELIEDQEDVHAVAAYYAGKALMRNFRPDLVVHHDLNTSDNDYDDDRLITTLFYCIKLIFVLI
jgi:hypothetical protein